MPTLEDGEFYFATDTAQLFVGFGGLNFKVGTGMAQVQLQDGSGNNITSTSGALDVNIKSNTDTPIPVSASVLPLPANAAQEVGGNLASLVADQTNGSQKCQLNDPTTFTGANVVAKGTQGANALATQDLKDSGRVFAVYSTTVTAAAANTEELTTLTPLTESPVGTLSTGTAATNFTVPAGKRFRIQNLHINVTNITTAAVVGARAVLRISNNAAITTASAALASAGAVTATALLGETSGGFCVIPDGLELSGTENFGVTYFATSVDAQIIIVLIGYFY